MSLSLLIMESSFLQLYARTLDLQVQLISNETISVVTGLSSFQSMKQILDVGCGVGSQLSVLKESFRHKTYLGLDSCEEFIESAIQRFSDPEIQFQIEDIQKFNTTEKYDLAFCFAVFQHLSDARLGLASIAKCLSENGVIVIFDTNGNELEFESMPDLPELRRFYQSISGGKTSGKRNTNCLAEIKSCASEFGLRVVSENVSSYRIENATRGQLYYDYITNVIQLVHEKYEIQVDRQKIESELQNWRQTPNSFAKLTGGSWLVLERIV